METVQGVQAEVRNIKEGKSLFRALDRQNDPTVAGSSASGRPYSEQRSISNGVLYTSLHSPRTRDERCTRKKLQILPLGPGFFTKSSVSNGSKCARNGQLCAPIDTVW